MKNAFGALLSASVLFGCSTVMESNRPAPVDLSEFTIGEDRLDVVSEVGAPTSTMQNGANACDVYQLVIHGPGALGKGAIIFGEAAADVVTLGLAEVVLTPTEAATKSQPHTVLFCYTPNLKLTNIHASGSATAMPAAATLQNAGAAVPKKAGLARRPFGARCFALTQSTVSESRGAPDHGVLVREVEPGGAAESAGLLVGDVILAFGSNPVQTPPQLQAALNGVSANETVTVVLWRDGREIGLPIKF